MRPDADVVARPTALVETLLGSRDGDEATLVFEDRRRGAEVWERARLRAEVLGLAAALRAVADPGDRAVIVLPTGPDYVVAVLACLASGIIAVPASAAAGARRPTERERLTAIARDCAPRVAIAGEDAELPADLDDAIRLPPKARRTGPIDHAPASEDIAVLQYTSGSTASPKGVMVTFANLGANLETLVHAYGVHRASTVVSWLPLFHDMGLIAGLLLPLYAGCRLVLTSPFDFVERPRRWLELITRWRGTITLVPNFAYQLCMDRITDEQIEGLDLSSLTMMGSGAEPIRPELMTRFVARFAAAGLPRPATQNCYGLAEATLLVSATPFGTGARSARFAPDALAQGRAIADDGGTVLADCGPPAHDCNVAIVDLVDGRRLTSGRVGEIWVAGPSVSPGYWQRAETSAATMQARLAGEHGRWLRTGDLGFLYDNHLFVTGRCKDLIILRGQNVAPQDIEDCIERSVPGLRPGRVAAFSVSGESGESIGVAAECARGQTGGHEVILQAIRVTLGDTFDEAPRLVLLLRAGDLPRTTSGKLRRSACLAAWRDGTIVPVAAYDTAPEEPETATEASPETARIAALWQEILGKKTPAPNDDFFVAGGDSLTGAALAARIESALGWTPPPGFVFLARTPAAQAAALAQGLAQQQATPETTVAPSNALSVLQQALWTEHRLDPNNVANNIGSLLTLRGRLDLTALRAAFTALARRHAALHSVIVIEDGRPVWRALPDFVPELGHHVTPDGEAPLHAALARPFDLAAAPPLRACVVTADNATVRLLVALHHVAADGVVAPVLIAELGRLYDAARTGVPPDLADPPPRPADPPRLDEDRAFWRAALVDAPVSLELATDRARTTPHDGGFWRAERVIAPATQATLARLAGSLGLTQAATGLALFAALLHRAAGGADDLVIGVPVSLRPAQAAGWAGHCMNAVPVRLAARAETGLLDLLQATGAALAAAVTHARLPFAELVEMLRPPRDALTPPFFRAMFNHRRDAPIADRGFADLEVGPFYDKAAAAPFDITLEMTEREGRTHLAVDLAADLFDRATAERLIDDYLALADVLAAGGTEALGTLLPVALRPSPPLPRIGISAEAAVRKQARAHPNREAVRCGSQTLTYGALDALADTIADALRATDGWSDAPGTERIVGLAMTRGAALPAVILGIWRAGAALLPLDPDTPPARKDFMLRDCGVALVLADDASLDAPVPVVPVPSEATPRRRDARRSAADPHPQALAYVLYTSGSTGAPKGVAITHEALARHLDDFRATHRISADDVVLQSSTIGFDVFLHELLPALMSGGRVVMRGPAPWSFDTLNAALRSGVTFARIPTSFWRQWLAHAPDSLPSLRQITVGGEALPGDALAAWQASGLRDVALDNLYGPTETTVACLHHAVSTADADSPVVSIGRPYPSRTASIRDRAGNLVVRSGTGELCIGGPTVARGYAGRPGLTAERFVPDPDGTPGARLYRTGDLTRWRPDRAIDFLGRLDTQIKLRGIRIEPAEIEAALRGLAGVDEAVVMLRDIDPAPVLVGYVAGRADVARLRHDLATRLPAAMVPTRFVVLETFPLLASGKVDRAALPLPPEVASPEDETVTPTEQVLRVIWHDVLGLASIGISDDFFALGGDSILGLRVVARARENGLALSPRQVFEAPTIAGLARLARSLGHVEGTADAAPAHAGSATGRDGDGIEAVLPVTPLQRGLLLLATQSPQDPYHAQHVFALDGLHDPEALRAAWAAAVARHAALRTVFVWPEPDQATMVVHRTGRPRLSEHDWRHLDDDDAASALATGWAAAKVRGFDFSALGPELLLIRRSATRYWLVWRLHHAQIDGWSLALVLDEVARGLTSTEAAPSFARYVDWLAGRATDSRLAAWRDRLATIDAPTPLPRARPVPTPLPYAEQALTLTPAAQTALQNAARRHGVTHSTLVQATWAWLLSRHAGANRVVFGVTLSGRPDALPDVERIVGLFINTMPLIVTLDPAQPLKAWLAAIQSDMLDLWDDADLPAHALQAQSALPPGAALFDSIVVVENYPVGRALRDGHGGLSLRHVTPDRGLDGTRPHHGRNHYGLSLIVQPQGLSGDDPDQLQFALSYATDRIDHATAAALLAQFDAALQRLCGSTLDAPLVSLAPAPTVLAQEALAQKTAPGLLTSVAQRADIEPHGIALSARHGTLSWAALWTRAGGHAAQLTTLGVGPETLVAFVLPRGFDIVSWSLAVWRAGGACMPLDPAHPPARLREILARSGCRIVVAGSDGDWLPPSATRLDPDDASDESAASPPDVTPHPAQTAYVIHTSGSTGRPKGVAVSHAALDAYLDGLPPLLPADIACAAWVSSPAADLGHTVLFGALRHGWTLHIPDEDDLFDPARFAAAMREGRVDLLKITPSHMRAVLESGDALPARCLGLGGEVAPPALLERISALRPDCAILNHYGPTETTVGVLAGGVTETDAAPALGRPLAHARITLHAPDGGGVEPGMPGEICGAGPQVARGYLGAPGLTAERFLPDESGPPGSRLYRTGDLGLVEPDGRVRFLGRADAQVKINGVRVELAEVEACLARLPGVARCAVLARDDADGRARLLAWVVGDADPLALRTELAQRLPGAMVPAAIVPVADLPLTANGKLDPSRLPAPAAASHASPGAARPETARETLMREIWQAVLKRAPIGLDEDFFALGGDSIASLQIISRARESGLHIAPRDVFAHSTIAALTAVAREGRAISRRHVVTDVDLPLTPIQRRFFARHPHGEAHWNQAVVLHAPGALDETVLRGALEQLAMRHDALRLRFHASADGWRQRVLGVKDSLAALFSADLRESPDAEADFAALRETCHRAMDLQNGPLLAALHVRLPGDEGRLMLAIHHLAVDGVSWRVLVEDFRALIQDRALPAQDGTSWSRWTQHLAAYATESAPGDELAWWRGMLASADDVLPLGDGPADTTIGGSREIVVRLDEAETTRLLQRAAGAWRLRAETILVAALVQALSAWRGRPGALLEMEGHGREDLIDDVDLTRTVGWFTTRYPLWLPLDAEAPAETALVAAKEALRAVPARGFHYGLLSPDGLRPNISFNYLGRFEADDGAWGILRDSVGASSAPAAPMAYALDINAIVLGGALSVTWRYSPGRIADAAAHALAEDFAARLRALVAHCLAHSAPRSASDFPLAGLDQTAFEALGLKMHQVADLYPATPLQAGLLMHAEESGLPAATAQTRQVQARQAYVNQLRATLSADVEIAPLRAAWRAVVARHDVLRTAFIIRAEGRPLQCILHAVDLPIAVLDWRDAAGNYEARLAAWRAADLARGFDLVAAPLLRVALLRRPDGQLDMIWTHHHALTDGWSAARIFGELATAYAAIRAGAAPAAPATRPFRDYVAWLEAKWTDAAWWQAYLDGAGDDARLLDAIGLHGHADVISVARQPLADLMPALEAAARRRRITLSTLVQAAWALVLSRFAGRRHVVFGITVAGRPPDLVGAGEMVGLFINSLPLRVGLPADARLDAWLGTLQAAGAELSQHSHVPLAEVQRLARQPGQPLFDSLLVFENYPVDEAADGALRPVHVEVDERTHFPLTLTMTPGARARAHWSWDAAVISADTAGCLRDAFRSALDWLSSASDAHVGDFALPGGASVEAAEATEPAAFVDVLTRIAAQPRDATAVVCGDETLDYATLLSRAAGLSRRLGAILPRKAGEGDRAEHGGGGRRLSDPGRLLPSDLRWPNHRGGGSPLHHPSDGPPPPPCGGGCAPTREERVGLCAGRSAALVWGLLGIMGAGAAYVPLDPAYPRARLAQALDDAGITRIVADATGVAALGDLVAGRQVIRLEDIAADDNDGTPPTFCVPHADQLAYVIYTSGSTGVPKGVGIPHGALAALLDAMDARVPIAPHDRWLAVTSVSFDIAALELFLPLIKGACVILAREHEVADGAALAGLIASREASVLQATPSGWKLLLAAGWRDGGSEDAKPLRGLSGGEALPADLAATLIDRGVALWNVYGPTETTIWSSAAPVTHALLDGVAHARLGTPLDGECLRVLGEDGLAVPQGGTGELCIGGAGLARGYLGRPGLTAERFVPDPAGPPSARLYRTGDLVRAEAGADTHGLAYLGRLDHQVKLRGHRIELGEIEAALRAVPGVADAAVALHGPRLVGYVTGGADVEHVRKKLGERLPAIMVPQIIVPLDALPLTANGKLDRKKLAEPKVTATGTAPRDETETRVVRAVTEVLGLPTEPFVEDSFFHLGGDSISAMRLVVRLRGLGLRVTTRQIFDAPVLGELAALAQPHVAEAEAAAARPKDLPPGIDDMYAATSVQAGMLYHGLRAPGSGLYVGQLRLRLGLALDVDVLRRAFDHLIARHAILRTGFEFSGDGGVLQVVRARVDWEFSVVDGPAEAAAHDAHVDAWCAADRVRGFDVARAPLLRVGVLRGPDGTDVVWTSHHALLDGWSQSRLLGELSLAYAALRAGGVPSLGPVRPYRDYIAWLARRDAAAESAKTEAWWRAALAGDEPALLLSSLGDARPSGDVATPGAERQVRERLPEASSAALRAAARRQGLTLGTLLQGAWALVLSRWGGRRRVAFGVTVAGRPAELDGVEAMLGLFINSLPVWVEVRADADVWAFLADLQKQAGALREHEATPLPLLQRWNGRGSEGLFDSLLVFENYPVDAAAKGVAGDLAPRGAAVLERTHYPLTIMIDDGEDGLSLRWLWDGSRLAADTVATLRRDFAAVLDWMAAARNAHVGDFVLPGAASVEAAEATAPAVFLDVLSRIAAQPREALAVTCGDETLDYATLLARAASLSRRLGPVREERVGLCAGRSAALVWGLLGIMGAGAAYVPLDPAYPRARLAQALDDAGITRIVADAAGVAALGDLVEGLEVIRLEDIAAQDDRTPHSFVVPQPDQLAYVIYTSGSTGVPKGVGIPHGALAALLEAMDARVPIAPHDRWLSVTSVSFDIAALELFLPLIKGAQVILAREHEVADGAALATLIASREASVLQATPSGWKLLLAAGWRDGGAKWPALRGLSGGEALPADLATALIDRGVALWNVYGPTETTIWSSAAPVTPALLEGVAHARLGAPLDGECLRVLGEDGLAVPQGGTGELCIGGVGLARGYLGRPGLTAERFVPDPSGAPGARLYRTGDSVREDDRGLAYLGRLDHQVKLRGHRIELGEIEAALRAVPGVADAATAVHGARLVGYVTGSVEPDAVRERLAERLPAIMVPQVIVPLDALPLTANGKLDRKKLAEPQATATGTAPRNATETTICAAFATALGLERVYRDSVFFALGGDSIGVMGLSSSLSSRLGTRISVADVFRHPTPAALAAQLAARADAAPLDELLDGLV